MVQGTCCSEGSGTILPVFCLLPLGLDALIYPNCGRAGQAVAVCSLFAASSHLQVRLGSPEMALLCRVGPEH